MWRYPWNALVDLQDLFRDIQKRGVSPALANVLRPDAEGSWQFTKYLVIGVSSLVVFYGAMGIFRYGVQLWNPDAFTTYRLACNLFGITFSFIPTNYFTYVTNRKWVFVAGKHDAKKEFALFTLAAALSFVFCQLGAWWLIKDGRLNDFFVSLSVIVISTFVNFIFRKCIVFAA